MIDGEQTTGKVEPSFADLVCLVNALSAAVMHMAIQVANSGATFERAELTSKTDDHANYFREMRFSNRKSLERTVKRLGEALETLGNFQNGNDSAVAEDEAATTYAFDAYRRYLAGQYGEEWDGLDSDEEDDE